MTTLKLKPNARKTPPMVMNRRSSTSSVQSKDWSLSDLGVMSHTSGFSIQFFNREECEITNIPANLSVTKIRELTSEAMKRNRNY